MILWRGGVRIGEKNWGRKESREREGGEIDGEKNNKGERKKKKKD